MLFLLIFLSVAQAAPQKFTDAVLRASGTALVYTWSPHMNLSVRGLDEALEREQHGGPHVIAVLDPACNRSLAKKIAGEHHWNVAVLLELASTELEEKGARIHFPSYLFLKDGHSVGTLIPGYKTKKELAWFQQRSQR